MRTLFLIKKIPKLGKLVECGWVKDLRENRSSARLPGRSGELGTHLIAGLPLGKTDKNPLVISFTFKLCYYGYFNQRTV